VLYNLARAEARLGNRVAAVRTLDRLARQGAVRPVQDDSAFASLRDARDFREVARRVAAGAAPIARSDTAFVLPDPDFIPEGIAWDPADGAFYVGSLSGRGIVRVAGDSVSPWVRPDSTRLTQILGLRVDQPRRRLWVASLVVDTAAPRFLRGPGGWAALEAYQLPTGRRLGRWVPDSSGPHLLNDIAVTPAGDVYVTDSEGSALHRLAGGEGTLERVHHEPARFVYPNGVVLSPDARRLYVAHWEGLSSFDLAAAGTLTPERVTAPAGVATTGIDGLYRCADGLLAVQYLLDFSQVTRFGLTPRGRSVAGARALERRHPAQTGPTTGAPARDAFYYIANAQLERLAEDQSVKPGPDERSVVLRMPLDGTCSG
jgi:sugar lactone lactonase YvrE